MEKSVNKRLRTHFGHYVRPNDFINKSHCDECEEHYQTLLDVHASDLRLHHVENPGADPTCFLSSEGFRYYFWAMAQIAENHPDEWMYIFLGRINRSLLRSFNAADLALCLSLLKYWQSELIIDDSSDINRLYEAIRVVTEIQNERG